ncbi:hypothetical protein K1W69_03420 [Hoeflea sp. WL0058]|uniref:Uncharacterized protein n=1 Tax=Flavimaribacter sediminis TaxID=2865987 RepID=A0AAE2ZJK6_9HYPH|nr:hypothetical protein [Flavimaribacter sediminis]MBW8636226.1 hypothetical protein [Flavimaribacter sediminis]
MSIEKKNQSDDGWTSNPPEEPVDNRPLNQIIAEKFIKDFAKYGDEVIEALRVNDPKAYLTIVAKLAEKTPQAQENSFNNRSGVAVIPAVPRTPEDIAAWEERARRQQEKLLKDVSDEPYMGYQ